MNILTAEHLSKSYGDKILFNKIGFTISEKQRIGLIGVNGTGKSTLLKIVSGLEAADEGEVIHARQFRVEYLPQNPEFDEEITVLDYLYKGDNPIMQAVRDYEGALYELEQNPEAEASQKRLFQAQARMDSTNAWEAGTQAKTILTRLGISEFHKPASLLSGGQRKRVALAAALIQPADLLILDEPTNHIDNETVEWLEEYLTKYRGALLLVTHDRYFLDRVTDTIFEISQGKLYSYEGNYAVYLEKKADRQEQEASSEAKRQNLLRRELAWLRRGARARTTKQKARIQRVEELKEQGPGGQAERLDLSVSASRLGKKIVEIEQLSKSFDGRTVIRDFNYIALPNDRIGIIGRNGSGKTTLLNLLAGRLQPDDGRIELGQTVKLAYYTQESQEMDEQMRVIEYIKEGAEMIRTQDGQTISAAQMLERFLFSPSAQWTPIGKLSGGERRRLYLLRTLMGEPNVLLLDEPTNDLDIETLTVLEDYLDSFPGVVITVSHDRYFLDRTADRLFSFEDAEGRVRVYEGSYSDYLAARRNEPVVEEADKKSKTAGPDTSTDPRDADTSSSKRPRKLSYKEQKEWDEIEQVIAGLEERAERLQAQIAEAGSDVEQVQSLYEEQRTVAEELDRAMDRWAELSELVEQIEQEKRK
ncbi:ABC-F family ATP-binding cassette domain-containing protein [Paenibacillus sp. J2TS4]|uniref:ABC-F family ATP-binding cassette domain-containing protein n=1 Tax=Paenibacillus sp. J2TS4 TaxID=2807194 RepID=UPI001AFFD1FF|nr:ABC-F family ATP-binding cassette domain-containing protein [Paenibacillus sp. J2TS4]GIP32689.1 ABC transporter ATP-binding protein [Paenibacillus sp. J2TS4]